ncbi:hypothetical protein L1987_09031 [Smallanthus sonchifolius]|uniref:Uncharacterized protein n=1 Tax=Smallanthus sonchifolius TaxID=185202 RepID=A0ACB9JP26_9ASTR|nr:hypothetical protein L1987_09031 [Smallanthus sonchifolius]
MQYRRSSLTSEDPRSSVKGESVRPSFVTDDLSVFVRIGSTKVEDEVVADKENEEVVRDEDVVENILDDEVDNENVVKDATATDEHKGGAANEKVNESGGDENSGTNNEEHEEKKWW